METKKIRSQICSGHPNLFPTFRWRKVGPSSCYPTAILWPTRLYLSWIMWSRWQFFLSYSVRVRLGMTRQNFFPIWRIFRALFARRLSPQFSVFYRLFFTYFDFFSDIKRVQYRTGKWPENFILPLSHTKQAYLFGPLLTCWSIFK